MEERIYIVGAHSRAQTLAGYLQYLYPNIVVEAYLYDNDEKNPEKIGDSKVIRLDERTKLHKEYPVYIGTRGIYHPQIIDHLKQIGFDEIHPVTVELDIWLRNQYMEKYFAAAGRKFEKIDALKEAAKEKAAVYVVRSVHDKELRKKYVLASYEKEILAGAALVGNGVVSGMERDDTGDNISNQNGQFCELTALYWIWKHAKEEVVGLVHYRRRFILPEDWMIRMRENGVDVILPVPLLVEPDLESNFKKRHEPEVWDIMMETLKKRDILQYRDAEAFFRGKLYSPCNMFIMRRFVLDKLCSWLFPILFQVAEHGGIKKDKYQNRYPGFLSERLITYFFERHRHEYKVIYSDKNFLP